MLNKTDRLAKHWDALAKQNRLFTDGASLMAGMTKEQLKVKREHALNFRRVAFKKGFKGGTRLFKVATERYGEAAASEITFKRFFSEGLPESDTPAVTQAAEIFDVSVADLRQGRTREAVTVPADRVIERETSRLLPTVDKAADATLGDHKAVARVSESLMDSRLGSLHAFLTFYLADKLQAQDATGGP